MFINCLILPFLSFSFIQKYAFNISLYQDVDSVLGFSNETFESYFLYNINNYFLLELQSFQLSLPLFNKNNSFSYYGELGILFPANSRLKLKLKGVRGSYQPFLYRIGFSLDL